MLYMVLTTCVIHFSAIPSAPRSLKISFVKENSLEMVWKAPLHLGGRNDVYYDINCLTLSSRSPSWIECSGNVQYHPKATGVKDTVVVVTSLDANTPYRFRVQAKNGVSGVAREPAKFSEVEVTTKNSSKFMSLYLSILVLYRS